MTQDLHSVPGHIGDWLEVSARPGAIPRRGQILDVLGRAAHTHYRVRWDEEHESLFYPADRAAIVHPAADSNPRRHSNQAAT